uniref:Uncharacterized protein n=1 Tax=Anopheles coluzzii TaxID=1518534 RepID=A0A8W7PWY3_ANOCL
MDGQVQLNTGMREGLTLVLRLLIEPPVAAADGDRLIDGIEVRRISTGISVREFDRSNVERIWSTPRWGVFGPPVAVEVLVTVEGGDDSYVAVLNLISVLRGISEPPPAACSLDMRRSTGIREGGVVMVALLLPVGFVSGLGGFFVTIGGLLATTGGGAGAVVPFCAGTTTRSAAVGGSGAFSVISVTKPPFVRGAAVGPLLSRRARPIELRCGGCGGSVAAATPFERGIFGAGSGATGASSACPLSASYSICGRGGGGGGDGVSSSGSSKSSSVCKLKSSFSSSIITMEEGCDSDPPAPSIAVVMVTMLSAVRENFVTPPPVPPFSVIGPAGTLYAGSLEEMLMLLTPFVPLLVNTGDGCPLSTASAGLISVKLIGSPPAASILIVLTTLSPPSAEMNTDGVFSSSSFWPSSFFSTSDLGRSRLPNG